jgi:predicted lactoylglutathione lyase
MEQRVSLITLGVTDVRLARAFYERLGWQGQEVEETVFFQLGGVALVLWGRDKLALDAGVEDEGRAGFGRVALAHKVRSRTDVDVVLAEATAAGAVLTRPADDTFYGGYAGYFRDLDGHVWEIAYNPGFPLSSDGAITVPDFGTARAHRNGRVRARKSARRHDRRSVCRQACVRPRARKPETRPAASSTSATISAHLAAVTNSPIPPKMRARIRSTATSPTMLPFRRAVRAGPVLAPHVSAPGERRRRVSPRGR